MRVLFTTAPMVGHFYPMVSYAWALRAAGHEVLVAAPENFADTVTGAGLTAAGALPAVDMPALMATDRQGKPVPASYETEARIRRSGGGWARLGAASLQATLTLVDVFRPDVVVSEPLEFAGQLAAHRSGIPWVEHGWGLRPAAGFAEAARAELEPELTRFGLAALPEPALRLDPCPPSFQHPGVRDGTPLRYVPFNGARPRPELLDRAAQRPSVFVTFGSLLPQINPQQTMPLLRFIIQELPTLGVDVLVGVSPKVAAQLPEPAGGAGAVGFLPLNEVLPRCSQMIHYGGSGTMMTALAFGVPQIVLAAAVADAPDNAARVTAAGIGVGLTPEDAMSCEPVRDACRKLLADATFAERAALLAADNAAQPSPAEAVSLLERLR
jgi:UDP:flavonoid glycosyltransferase YjiC (YdhE family)